MCLRGTCCTARAVNKTRCNRVQHCVNNGHFPSLSLSLAKWQRRKPRWPRPCQNMPPRSSFAMLSPSLEVTTRLAKPRVLKIKKNTAGQTLTAHAVSATPGSHALAAGLLSSSSSSQQQLSRKGKPLLSQSLPLITENTPAKYKPAPLTAIEIEAVMSGGAVF